MLYMSVFPDMSNVEVGEKSNRKLYNACQNWYASTVITGTSINFLDSSSTCQNKVPDFFLYPATTAVHAGSFSKK